MALPTNFKLGKKAPEYNRRIPMLSKYTVNLPAAPKTCNWTNNQTEFGMMANDRLGDCTAAALAHQLQIWTLNCEGEHTLTDEEVINFYSATCGYTPNNPDSDQGGIESAILKQWLTTPQLLAGHSLAGFASFRPFVQTAMCDSIYILGGAYLGFNLPACIENQGDLWQVPAYGTVKDGAPGSLGGHAVVAVAYDERTVTIISWGTLYKLTWDFVKTYCEEAYALVSEDWLNIEDISPSGFDLITLKKDMYALATLNG